MQIKRINNRLRVALMVSVLICSFARNAYTQECRDSLNEIIQSYQGGEWDLSKEQSLNFLHRFGKIKYNFFDDYRVKNSGGCVTLLPQVYYYLIRCFLRLNYLDSAKLYYADALRRDIVVDLDSISGLKNYFKVKRRQYALGIYAGTNMLANTYKFNYKIGAQFGLHKAFKLEAFVDLSYSDRVFNHESSRESGPFAHAIEYSPGQFPQYHFSFEGRERFIDLAYMVTLPFDLSLLLKTDRVKGYLLGGPDLAYYINSKVNRYTVQLNRSSSDFTVYESTHSSRSVNELGMDLTRLYTNRLSVAAMMGIGSKFKLSREWIMFAELRYTLGTNYKYRYAAFADFHPGISYLTLVAGIRRSHTFLKPKNFLKEL